MELTKDIVDSELRVKFFEYLFGDEREGWLCIATQHKVRGAFRQYYYEWPRQKDELGRFLDTRKDFNVWFCTSLLKVEERNKHNCLPHNLVWADLDYIDPDKLTIPPSCVVESSPKRFQAYWRLEATVPSDVAEEFSKKLAYQSGADRSGWPLGKLLRVPHTRNYKYETPPLVRVTRAIETLVPQDLFEELPQPEVEGVDPTWKPIEGEEVPNVDKLPPVENVVYAYRTELSKTETFTNLYSVEPSDDADWSALLWRLINVCAEAGMDREETFAVALNAKCNKYQRDNRPVSHLWRDILKAHLSHSKFAILKEQAYATLEMPNLVDPDKITEDSFVVDYKKWGVAATDAPEHYHELSCFIALSALTASGLRLETSFGELVPNLWGMILGESTLTRKTTVMRMAMDIVSDLDQEIILATDGSAEGLLTGLSNRAKRVSVFYKDEISGFFDSINRKDYLAGMQETLTQLYDVPKFLQRLLRKETITIVEPYFIFFGGGIRDKVYSLIDEEYVLSGFLPRFLVVSGENDLSRVRRTGPPTTDTFNLKNKVLTSMGELKEQYTLQTTIQVAGQNMIMPARVDAFLSDDAWKLYGDLEMQLIEEATDSPFAAVALPTFQRLGFSLLKMAILIAVTRKEPKENRTIVVDSNDIKQAAFYIQQWGKYSVDMVMSAGKPNIEKTFDKVLLRVRAEPGCTKSSIMMRFRFSSREMKDVMETLMDRGLITISKKGRTTKIYPVG
jgi:hypothetical protein